MSTISAGNTLTTGFIASSDTTGNLVFQTNGTTTALTLTTGQNATLANNISVVGSVSSVNTFGFKNRIINGGMLISQRNTSFTNVGSGGSPGYTLDRWCGWRGAYTSNLDISQVAGYGTYQYALRAQRTSGSSSTQNINVAQVLESVNIYDLIGQTVTVSFWAKAGSNYSGGQVNAILQYSTVNNQTSANLSAGSWTGSAGSNTFTISSTATQFSFTCTVPSNALSLAVQFSWNPTGTASTNDFIDFTGVQLEVGTQATSFDFRGIGNELLLCQRYFQKSVDQSTAVGTAVGDIRKYPNIDVPVSISGQALSLYSWFKTTMRTTPTIAFYDGAGTVSKITGIASSTAQTNGVSLNDVQATDNGVQFRAYDIAYYGFGLYYTASAEL